jgi:hypothetical protein
MLPEIPPKDTSPKPKWTVMVYMGATTIEGTAPLIVAADADLAEMDAVGSGGPLNVFVQINGRGAVPQHRHIGVGPWTDVLPDERDFAGGQALEHFVRRSLKEAHHAPWDHSMLVLWGHAYDFTFGHAKTTDGLIDALDFAELSDVLKRLRDEYGAQARLDILAFDACDLATVEMACQLEPFAKYLLGSQIGIPIPGFPYDRILDRLRNPMGRLMAPSEFGGYVVRRFCEAYSASSPVSLSLLDLKRAPELFAHAEVLALALSGAIGDPDTLDLIMQVFSSSQTSEGRPYIDVADVCLNLMRESSDEFVVATASALGDFLLSPVPPLVGKSEEGEGRPFVLERGRNAGETARLNGISIYAPHVVPSRDFAAVRPLYQNFDFAKKTLWSDLVHTLAELS